MNISFDLKNNLKLKRRRGDMSLILIILLVLIIIALIVWFAFWGKPQANSTPSPSVAVQVSATPTPVKDPYAGWKAYTLKYDKFSLKYPADWVLTDTSITDSQGTMDKVAIKSPDGFAVNISTGLGGIGGSCEDCKAFETTTDTILGEKTGINILGSSKGALAISLMRFDDKGTISYDCTGLCTIPSKNTKTSLVDSPHGLTIVTGGYPLTEAEAIKTGTANKIFSYDVFKADPNIATAKLIFKSFAY